jgi:hypothetical protein
MAFVGYSCVEDAAAALKYFQATFIDTSRISIEVRLDGTAAAAVCCRSGGWCRAAGIVLQAPEASGATVRAR